MKWVLLACVVLVACLSVCEAKAPLKLDAVLPAHYDLREAHPRCSQPVTDAGDCDPAALIEGLYSMSVASCIQTGRPVQLSLGYAMSCCKKCGACAGVDLYTIFDLIKNNGSTNTSCVGNQRLPHCPTRCSDGSPIVTTRATFTPAKGVAQIQQAISTVGPVVALINGDALEMYTGGVLTCKGVKPQLDHVVSLIGWGIENNIPYWIATNNWGPDWGENGFFRIERGIDACGVELINFTPKLL